MKSQKAKSLISKKKVPYWKAKEVQITNVSERVGDFITVFQTENGQVKMTVIFKLGYNTAINPENFPEEFNRFKEYVEFYADVNFRKYYDENIKTINKSIKIASKELKKESRNLRRLARRYKRKYIKKDKVDEFLELEIQVQQKLVNTLKTEINSYDFLIMKYKNRNSEIRRNLIQEN